MQNMSETKEWVIAYIRHRDIINRKLQDIAEVSGNVLLAKYSDRQVSYLLCDEISDFEFLKEYEGQRVNVVLQNRTSNLKVMQKNWDSLAKKKDLKLIFININSSKDKRWIIIPYIHNRIADKSSLAQGLKSLFESVDEVK